MSDGQRQLEEVDLEKLRYAEPKERKPSLQHPRPRYGFVECPGGQRSSHPSTDKLVRTHVMYNFLREKQTVAGAQSKGRKTEGETSQDSSAMLAKLAHLPVTCPERWSPDPFDAFPIPMRSNIHELLYLCAFTVPDICSITSPPRLLAL
ncbi:hypothetical protein MMC10_003437 [Thelotrema lepadinum]|nr:hypothetical protein [Thelotrema lepadinum]